MYSKYIVYNLGLNWPRSKSQYSWSCITGSPDVKRSLATPQPRPFLTLLQEDGLYKREHSSLPEWVTAIYQFITSSLKATLVLHLMMDDPFLIGNKILGKWLDTSLENINHSTLRSLEN